MEEKWKSPYKPSYPTHSGWIKGGFDMEIATTRKTEPAEAVPVRIEPIETVAEPVRERPVRPADHCNPYAMALVQKQGWGELYDIETGFDRGTIFPCLDLPFMGKGACRYE